MKLFGRATEAQRQHDYAVELGRVEHELARVNRRASDQERVIKDLHQALRVYAAWGSNVARNLRVLLDEERCLRCSCTCGGSCAHHRGDVQARARLRALLDEQTRRTG